MKFAITDNKKKELFISLFQLLKNNSSNINLYFEKNCLHIQGMDKSHVCLFDLKLKSSWFSIYEKEEGDITTICISSNIFHNILTSATSEHDIIVHYKGDPDTIEIDLIVHETKNIINPVIKLNTNKNGEFSNYFKIPVFSDSESEILEIPEDVEYVAEFSINSKKILDLTSKMIQFGDFINLLCNENKIEISTNGVNGEMKVDIPVDDLTEYSITEEEEVNLTYSLNYLNKMCLTTKLSLDISFYINNDIPMKIKYSLEDGGELLFFIAPKIVE